MARLRNSTGMFCTFGSLLARRPVPVARLSNVECISCPRFFTPQLQERLHEPGVHLGFLAVAQTIYFGISQSGSGSFASSSSTEASVVSCLVLFYRRQVKPFKQQLPNLLRRGQVNRLPHVFVDARSSGYALPSLSPTAASFSVSTYIPGELHLAKSFQAEGLFGVVFQGRNFRGRARKVRRSANRRSAEILSRQAGGLPPRALCPFSPLWSDEE